MLKVETGYVNPMEDDCSCKDGNRDKMQETVGEVVRCHTKSTGRSLQDASRSETKHVYTGRKFRRHGTVNSEELLVKAEGFDR